MYKIIALIEDGFALFAGESVAKAVAEVEISWMAAALAVVAVGLPRNLCLRRGYRLNLKSGIFEDIFQPGCENWILVPTYLDVRFKIGCGRNAHSLCPFNRCGKGFGFRFILENCDQSRGVNDHIGSPVSGS